jgi:hypothetical protein
VRSRAVLSQKRAPGKRRRDGCVVAVSDMVVIMNQMTSVSTSFFRPVNNDFMMNFITKNLYSIYVSFSQTTCISDSNSYFVLTMLGSLYISYFLTVTLSPSANILLDPKQFAK